MREEFARYETRSVSQIGLIIRNFLVTVWNPDQSDIRHGINSLISRALRNIDHEDDVRYGRQVPALATLYEMGYDPPLDTAALSELPPDTLGHGYAHFIRDNGIDPLQKLMVFGTPRGVVEYSIRRAYKLHDVLHVVLGCDASTLGEVRIVSFSLGQSRDQARLAPALALLVLILHLLIRRPWQIPLALRLARRWKAIGRRCAPYSIHRMEDWMALPVAYAQQQVLGPALLRVARAN
jgi:hypothetical protein